MSQVVKRLKKILIKKILIKKIEKDCDNWKGLWWLKKDCDIWKGLWLKKIHAYNKLNLVVM